MATWTPQAEIDLVGTLPDTEADAVQLEVAGKLTIEAMEKTIDQHCTLTREAPTIGVLNEDFWDSDPASYHPTEQGPFGEQRIWP